MALFMGSDIQIPTSEWSSENPGFCVQEFEEKARDVKQNFSKSYVYYLASHEGCGCGFEFDEKKQLKELEEWSRKWENLSPEMKETIKWSPADEYEDYSRRKKCCEDLVSLIRQLLTTTDELELYSAPDSYHTLKPTTTKTITPDDIMIDGRFDLFPENDNERIFYKVKSEKDI
jgi:negative regulator of genetic competence, sporulation and motility